MRSRFNYLMESEQREIAVVIERRFKGLLRRLPIWWARMEVPRGMAVRMPSLASLPGSCLQLESPGGPHDATLAMI